MYSLKNKNILISGIGKGLGKEMMIQCIKMAQKYLDLPDRKRLKGNYIKIWQ